MKGITRILAMAVTAPILITLAACGDDDTPPAPTATAPAAATPTIASSATPSGTGVPLADRVAAAVAADDADALALLIQTQSLACSNAAGVGGPPPCSGAQGNPPEGTLVDAFPYGTCEREWQFDLVRFGRRFLDAAGELYAVVEIADPGGPAGLPASATHAVIYASADPALETGHALILSNDAIVAADSLCGGAVSTFLQDGPPLYGPEIVFEGPAFGP